MRHATASGIRQAVCNLSDGKNVAQRRVLSLRGHQYAGNSSRPYVSQYQADTTSSPLKNT